MIPPAAAVPGIEIDEVREGCVELVADREAPVGGADMGRCGQKGQVESRMELRSIVELRGVERCVGQRYF